MRKLFLFSMVVTLGLVACNKDDAVLDNAAPKQKVLKQEEMIPVAKLTDKNEIELLFLQRDVQEFFNRENPDEKLVFVEVQDDNKDGKNAGLLYRIYNANEKVTETSISFVVILEKGVYYAPVTTLQYAGGASGLTISCTTSDCSYEVYGCIPYLGTSCTPCDNGGKCTKTTSDSFSYRLTALVRALNYAVRL